jgi:hypothetical protein
MSSPTKRPAKTPVVLLCPTTSAFCLLSINNFEKSLSFSGLYSLIYSSLDSAVGSAVFLVRL